MVPFRTVEKSAFKAMLQAFDKQYVLPNRKYFSQKAVPALYQTVKEGIIRDLKEVYHFSMTTDIWSSVNMMPYMSLTIHYLNANWELQSKCLETLFIPESHTGDNLAEALRSSLQEWSLDEGKLACITTDNGANIVAAVRKLGWQWLNCFGHNLHLAVTNALKSEKDRTARAIGLCRTLVTTFSQSWQKKRKLIKEQAELNLPQHCLVVDCSTRWGSTQKMVERVLEQCPAIKRVLDDRRSQHLIPTWQDVEVLESVNAALKKVADFTDALSSETMVTASSLKPVLQLLREDLLLPTEEDTELARNLKKKMTGVLEEKYSAPATQVLLAKASFVDPRHKDSNSDDIKDKLLEEMLAVPEEGRDDRVVMQISMTEDGEGASRLAPPSKKKKSLADLLGKRQEQTRPLIPKRIRADTELARYLQEETLDAHSDPLAWWRDNQARFPLLSNVARKYMTVCATSTPSERVFSAAGNIVTPFRSSLKPDKVNMLVCLAKNIKMDK
ncbi:E3 SUMO-protein ligase ZBED1-like [Brachyhypopomus gauderio]|uniref:E3 SUMO-protein ligase ZBED1-like n=2 Tax=Brachyhypopomus gauderio TaxID=698409 RepID=UPI004041F8B0